MFRSFRHWFRPNQYYKVATICRLPKLSGLFCKKVQQKQGSFAKETWQFREPINRFHLIHPANLSPISLFLSVSVSRALYLCLFLTLPADELQELMEEDSITPSFSEKKLCILGGFCDTPIPVVLNLSHEGVRVDACSEIALEQLYRRYKLIPSQIYWCMYISYIDSSYVCM